MNTTLPQSTKIMWTSPYDLACTAGALLLGLFVGWLDLHVTEVLVTILALMTAGSVIGFLQPIAPWRWPVLIAIGLPIMATVAIVTGMQTAEPVHPDVRIALVALAFALLGSYAGAFIRRTVRALTSRSS